MYGVWHFPRAGLERMRGQAASVPNGAQERRAKFEISTERRPSAKLQTMLPLKEVPGRQKPVLLLIRKADVSKT